MILEASHKGHAACALLVGTLALGALSCHIGGLITLRPPCCEEAPVTWKDYL